MCYVFFFFATESLYALVVPMVIAVVFTGVD